jgi:hypothetical protein
MAPIFELSPDINCKVFLSLVEADGRLERDLNKFCNHFLEDSSRD